jgi:hypothetical protein
VRILYGTITIVKRYSKSTDLLECQTWVKKNIL